MGEGAGRQTRHRGLQQHRRQRLPASENVHAGVAECGQDEHLRPVLRHVYASFSVTGDWEGSPNVYAVTFGRGHQRTVGDSVVGGELPCPPSEFGVVGRIVETQRLGQPRRLGEPAAGIPR